MTAAITEQPVDLWFVAVGATVLLLVSIWGAWRTRPHDPWREAVLTARARDHGRRVRARRLARWARQDARRHARAEAFQRRPPHVQGGPD